MSLLILSLLAIYGIGLFVTVRGLLSAPEGYEGSEGFVATETPVLIPVPVHQAPVPADNLGHGYSHAA